MLLLSTLLALVLGARGATNEEWGRTINIAGLQRTLSQVMSKEFVLISLGIEADANKAKLQQTMQRFNTTLHALVEGDPAQGIVGAPNQKVADSLQAVMDIWTPFEVLLRGNADSVRYADGSANLPVLEAVSVKNRELLAASGVVVSGLVDAAKVAGASTNGLGSDIAGRQRSFIQSLCLQALLISQGIQLASNKALLKETKLMFEASHQGIIEGVPFAGLPVLTSMCTLHQMAEVTYYFSSFRPLLSEILNAHTDALSQETALRLASQISNYTEPLFQAMVEAVKLYNDDSQACDPTASMTSGEWRSFLTTLGLLRLKTQLISQYFMQVALGSNVHTSKVEITVKMNTASQLLRSLIEGRKAEGIPAPPTQNMVVELLRTSEAWAALESELNGAVRAEVITAIMVDRVAVLSEDVLKELTLVMGIAVQVARTSSPSTPAHLLDLTSQQAMLLSKLSKEAILIQYGIQIDEHWDALNASRALFEETHWKLLLGTPETNTTPALPKVSAICVIWRMREVDDLYAQLQQSAMAVARGSMADMDNIDRLSPLALDAMHSATDALVTGVCDNQTSPTTELAWLGLHEEAARLSQLSQDAASAFILAQNGGSADASALAGQVSELRASERRLMFGSWRPLVAAPPTQELFDEVTSTVGPAVDSFEQAAADADVLAVVDAAKAVLDAAESLRQKYLNGAMAANPHWPGLRVGVAVKQVGTASRIYKEALLYAHGFRQSDSELMAAIGEFETLHMQLKDGGGGLPAIIPERKDLLLQWQHIDTAWTEMRSECVVATPEAARHLGETLSTLITELNTAVPLCGMEDVEDPEAFPWTAAIYGGVGSGLVFCCCGIAYWQWMHERVARPDKDKQGTKRGMATEEV